MKTAGGMDCANESGDAVDRTAMPSKVESLIYDRSRKLTSGSIASHSNNGDAGQRGVDFEKLDCDTYWLVVPDPRVPSSWVTRITGQS